MSMLVLLTYGGVHVKTPLLTALVLASALILPGSSTAANATDYTFVLLDQAIYRGGMAHVNAAGQVALSTIDRENNPQACRWSITEKEALSLGTLASHDPRSLAKAINDRGHIVGTVHEEENNLVHAFYWTPTSGMRRLPSFGGSQTVPVDINDRDQVVGQSINADGLERAFLWTADNGIRDLGSLVEETEKTRSLTKQDSANIGTVATELGEPVLSPGGKVFKQAVISSVLRRQSEAGAVNEQGWVVGTSRAIDGLDHPFLWKPETGMIDLGILPGYVGGAPTGINNRGQVPVVLFKRQPFKRRSWFLGSPFLWADDEGLEPLPSPPGFNDIRPIAINNSGDILLWARKIPEGEPTNKSIEFTGFLLSGDGLSELPQLEGADLTKYSGINDRGHLVGSATNCEFDTDGEVVSRSARVFVAVPTGSRASIE